MSNVFCPDCCFSRTDEDCPTCTVAVADLDVADIVTVDDEASEVIAPPIPLNSGVVAFVDTDCSARIKRVRDKARRVIR